MWHVWERRKADIVLFGNEVGGQIGRTGYKEQGKVIEVSLTDMVLEEENVLFRLTIDTSRIPVSISGTFRFHIYIYIYIYKTKIVFNIIIIIT